MIDEYFNKFGRTKRQGNTAIQDALIGEFTRLKSFGIQTKKNDDKIIFSFKGVNTEVKNNETDIKEYLLSKFNI